MASKTEVKEIKRLASQGKSVNFIKNKLDLPKSTAYYHFKKEVGQKQKENQPVIPDDQDFKGEFCGIFAGDGNYYYDGKKIEYRIRIYLNHNYKYWEILADYLKLKLGKAPHLHTYPDKSTTVIDYSSKNLYLSLKESLNWKKNKVESICLKDDKDFSIEFEIGFLRGLMDTDGYRRPDHKRYVFTSASEELIKNTAGILGKLDISYTRFIEEDPRGYRDKHKNKDNLSRRRYIQVKNTA